MAKTVETPPMTATMSPPPHPNPLPKGRGGKLALLPRPIEERVGVRGWWGAPLWDE